MLCICRRVSKAAKGFRFAVGIRRWTICWRNGTRCSAISSTQVYAKPVIREENDLAFIEPVRCRVKYRNLTKAGLLRLPSFVDWG